MGTASYDHQPHSRPLIRAQLFAFRDQLRRDADRFMADGNSVAAVAILERWTRIDRSCPDLLARKGSALARVGRYSDAATAMAQAIQLDPRPKWLLAAARLAAHNGDVSRERTYLEAARSSDSLSVAQLRRLARLQHRAGHCADTVGVLDEALGKQDSPGLRLQRAEALIACRQVDAAARDFDRVLASPHLNERDLCRWAEMSLLQETAPERVVAALEPRAREPDCAWTVRLWLARALHAANRSVEAAEELRSCASSHPDQAWIWYELGVVLRHLGDWTESQAALNRARRLAPEEPRILRIAGQDHRHARGDEAFAQAQRAEANLRRYGAAEQVEVLYASAKALEDVGELGAAFHRYAAAGRAQKQLTPWLQSTERRRLDFLRSVVTRDYIAANRDEGLATAKPVFVFGMPRSGTSLVEEIVARHPDAYGAGETSLVAEALHGVVLAGRRLATTGEPLPSTQAGFAERGLHYLSSLERIAGLMPARIVDKMPGNYAWLGLIDLMLPGSIFVHCRRHPADVCLSAYKLYFGGQLPYSYDLRDLARAYRLYSETMAFCEQVLPPGRILDVWYEDLAENPEPEAERLIGSLGLSATADCLRQSQNPRNIRTASASQAREPIYRHAIGRWRRFKRHLGPLLEELGDEVAAYEREVIVDLAARAARLATIARLGASCPEVSVLLMAPAIGPDQMEAAYQLGIGGCLQDNGEDEDLGRAIRRIARGEQANDLLG